MFIVSETITHGPNTLVHERAGHRRSRLLASGRRDRQTRVTTKPSTGSSLHKVKTCCSYYSHSLVATKRQRSPEGGVPATRNKTRPTSSVGQAKKRPVYEWSHLLLASVGLMGYVQPLQYQIAGPQCSEPHSPYVASSNLLIDALPVASY